MRRLQVIIVPFNLAKGELRPAGHEPAKSAQSAATRAAAMAPRYVGVGVYGIWVDDFTLDACDLHEIARFGRVPPLDRLQAAA